MKAIPIFLILLFLTFYSSAQERQLVSRSRASENLEGKVVNKNTGKRINNFELSKLLREKPGLSMEMLYDKYGNLEKCLYDPNDPFKKYPRDPEKRPQIGEPFPEFVFTTINGEKYSGKALKGNWVLIHFRALGQFIQKETWERLVLDLQKARTEFDITALGVFAYDDDLNELVGEFQPDIKLVKNAYGFFSRFHLIQSPTTVLIDPEGIVIEYFYGGDPIDFFRYLEK